MSATDTKILPRVVIAGLRGDGGKSLVSIALTARLQAAGISVAPFKIGPDYIDAAWLGAAAKRPGRNLDSFMMSGDAVLSSLASNSGCDIAVIEGKRGLFDGMTEDGSHSTSELAKLIGAPVILVVDITKTTRTAAAFIRGCQVLDSNLDIAGVILNRSASLRQENIVCTAIEKECGIPVLGAIPKLGSDMTIPMRHLGLVCVEERSNVEEIVDAMREVGTRHLNIEAILSIARDASPLKGAVSTTPAPHKRETKKTIGILRGPAFSFYYPENLSALEEEGATLLDIDPMVDDEIPNFVDGLLVGGGFPELYAKELSNNRSMRESLRRRIHEGLPVYAECGGLMYLARGLKCGDQVYEMANVLKADVVQTDKPVGHGYVEARVDEENPFYEIGSALKGHEFHYSKAEGLSEGLCTALSLIRGSGLGRRRDGIVQDNVFASYTHVHALGTPEWAPGFFNVL